MGRKPIGGIFSVGRRGALPLEGFGAERGRRSGCGSPTASPTACGRGSRNSPASLHDPRWLAGGRGIYDWHYRTRALSAQRSAAGARGDGLLAADRAVSRRCRAAAIALEDHTLGMYQALIEARIPFEMVHDRLLDAGAPRPLQAADPAEHRRAVGRAVRADPRVMSARRQPGRAPSRRRSTTSAGAPRADFGLADLFGVIVRRRIEGADAELVSAARADPRRRASSAAGRAGGRGAHHQRRLRASDVTPTAEFPLAADADSVVSRPADGGGLSARAADRHPARFSCAKSGRAAWSTFPWDIDRTFWEVLSRGSRKLLRNAVAWAANEPQPVTVTGRACWTSRSGGRRIR